MKLLTGVLGMSAFLASVATGQSADSTSLTRAEAARRAPDVSGDSGSGAPRRRLAAADSQVSAAPSWDINVRSYETRDRVAHYVGVFSGRAREPFIQWLERGSRFEPLIRAQLKAGGLPEDMYFLALVESGFNPNAYSRAAAVGMWQFMTGTGRSMGLRIDWWVDERRDPVKSTTAAVRFIRDLRDQFGSLYLAAAAYNGGPGRVARGLVRYADDLEGVQGEDAFFLLAEKDYLRNETRDYVPQLIAAALIAKDPARYGVAYQPRPAFVYDSVAVRGGLPLAAVAKATRASIGDLQELNPHLLRGMTPPGDSSRIRIPLGAAAGFDMSLAALSDEERSGTKTVHSRAGETLKGVSRAHGVSEAAIRSFNPRLRRLKSGRLAAGQEILIPAPAVAAASLDVPDPSIERYPKRAKHKKKGHGSHIKRQSTSRQHHTSRKALRTKKRAR